MYIYHFWPLCMHCKRRLRFDAFLETTYDLFSGFWNRGFVPSVLMHILANFVIFDDFDHLIKMDILDLFWGPQTASSPKVTIYLPLSPMDPSGPILKPCYFDPLFWPFWTMGLRVLREAVARPQQAAFDLVEGPGRALPKPMPGTPKFWSNFDHFSLKKFCHFAYQGSCENAILTPFWPHFWAPPGAKTFQIEAKMCLFYPLTRRGPLEDPEGPQFDQVNFDHFGFEGPRMGEADFG